MQTYLVGGAVRDTLLKRPVTERDWVVVGTTKEAMLAEGFQQVGKDFPVFLHPSTHEEYALARTERKSSAGHTGFVCHSDPNVTLEEDLLRRDLTINAMAQDKAGKLIDPYHGQQDLNHRILRHVSPAFSEDPLRVLRVARLMAQLGKWDFTVAPETLALMKTICASGELTTLPKERLWKECEKALNSTHSERFFTVLRQVNAPLFHALGNQQLQQLQQACRATSKAEIRFSALLYHAPEALSEFKAPKTYQALASLCQRHLPTLINIQTPEQKLDLLYQLDAYRRPERFNRFLAVATIIISADAAKKILTAFQQTQTLSVTDPTIKGKAIGIALYQLRLTHLKRYTAEHS